MNKNNQPWKLIKNRKNQSTMKDLRTYKKNKSTIKILNKKE